MVNLRGIRRNSAGAVLTLTPEKAFSDLCTQADVIAVRICGSGGWPLPDGTQKAPNRDAFFNNMQCEVPPHLKEHIIYGAAGDKPPIRELMQPPPRLRPGLHDYCGENGSNMKKDRKTYHALKKSNIVGAGTTQDHHPWVKSKNGHSPGAMRTAFVARPDQSGPTS